MNLYYAMGGGLGHLTRSCAFLESFKLENESLILTSSNFADDKRVIGKLAVIKVDKSFENDCSGFQKHIQNIFDEFKIKTLFIDSFPFGIIGEFIDFEFPENLEINYVARLLKWKDYAPLEENNFPKFHQTFILEPLETEHQEFINQFSQQQIEIELQYPTSNLTIKDKENYNQINSKSPFWLIVHTGHQDEILELINYAVEMRNIEKAEVNLILISPNDLTFQKSHLFHFNFYPASVLFEQAERIFTACGFNTMEQTKSFRDKHFFIPFERRFDDQFARAARARNSLKTL